MFGKKIITALAALSMLSTSLAGATGQYYISNEYPSVAEVDLKYTPTDTDRADELMISLASLVGVQGSEDEIAEIIDELYDLFKDSADNYSLALLQSDRENTDANRQTLLNSADDALTLQEMLYDAFKLVYESEYKYVLNDMFGEETVEDAIENMPDKKYYELTKREEELISKYEAVYGDSDACAKLYLKLVGIRNEIAKEAGYDNYAELANETIYYRDYTDEEIAEFSESIITYYKPLLQAFLLISEKTEIKLVPMPEQEVIEKVDWLLTSINYEIGESFDYMIENGLYDIAFSDEKSQSSGAYTLYINKIKAPYIFMSPYMSYETDGIEPMKTLIHESGHYSALLNDPVNYFDFYSLNEVMVIDTAEVHSQGLEALSMPYYGRLFGKNASSERIMQLMHTVSAVIDGMLFHEFQTRVYESENLTVESVNKLAAELISKYYGMECTPEDAQEVWTLIPHTFQAPMYYLAYAVSGAASLGILAESEYDYESALDKYMQMSSCGVHVSFSEAAQMCGLDDIFSQETALDTVYAICKMNGILYEDIDHEAWYMDYFYDVADVFDGRSETEFEPESNITRGEFVEVIGKMYDYYVGADMNYTVTFADVDESDEETKYIAWASENGIIEGYSETEFGVNDEITREQLTAVLYRLAEFEEKTHNVNGDITGFADNDKVSDWAENAVIWAVDSGIINGRDGNMIVPQGNTTRAEAVKIVACYIENAY